MNVGSQDLYNIQKFKYTRKSDKEQMDIVPINFGLKYKPAKLGVEYHMKGQPDAHFVHEIPLTFVSKYSDIDDVTDELFEKFPMYLNVRMVSHHQVRRLVERLVKALGVIDAHDKENSNKGATSLSTNPPLVKAGGNVTNLPLPDEK